MSDTVENKSKEAGHGSMRLVTLAWLMAATFYFYQYAVRSSPAVMMPQMSEAFGMSAAGVASLLGLFYYGYSPFSLIAGAAFDRTGPRLLLPIAAAVMTVGSLLFATGDSGLAGTGRFFQGAGGVFAAVGSLYIAANYFPAAKAATFVGATQMFGMAGGAAGQFAVGPLISSGLPWNKFWIGMAILSAVLCIAFLVLLPKQEAKASSENWIKRAVHAFWVVFTNPQSIVCGLIAGLLFIPTTIFDMVWGVRYLQEGHGFDYGTAVLRSAMVPMGWIIGCPLLGFISDRIGRRKPVIAGGALVLLACLAWILFGSTGVFPPYALGLVAGIASGAAMVPYSVIKEANPPEFGGTATGVITFINFSLTAVLGPMFARLLQNASGGSPQFELAHYQSAFFPLILGVAIAIGLTFLLKETGPAAQTASPATQKEVLV